MTGTLFPDAAPPGKGTRPKGQFGRPRRITRAERAMAGPMTPKKLAAVTRRSLNSARATLERLAIPWQDVDNSIQGSLDVLLEAFDQFEREVIAAVEWLEEEVAE